MTGRYAALAALPKFFLFFFYFIFIFFNYWFGATITTTIARLFHMGFLIIIEVLANVDVFVQPIGRGQEEDVVLRCRSTELFILMY